MNAASLATKAAALPQAAGQGVGVPAELFMPLVNVGAIGVVLAWFMLRAEAKLDAHSQQIGRLRRSIDRLTQSNLLEVVTREDAPPVVKRRAEAMLDDLKTEQAMDNEPGRGKGGGFVP